MCGITCPIIKSLFHEHTLKYVEVVEDCTVMSDLKEGRLYFAGIAVTEIFLLFNWHKT